MRFFAPILYFSWIIILASAICNVSASSTQAEVMVGYYTYGTTAPPPSIWLWQQNVTSSEVSGITAEGVLDTTAASIPAWKVTDQTSESSPYYSYFVPPEAPSYTDIMTDGWFFSASARFSDDFGTNDSTVGIRVDTDDITYAIHFDLNSANDLVAKLDGYSQEYVLTANGSGTDQYHMFDLYSAPGSNVATFRFDGQVLGEWNGIQSGHAPGVNARWGFEDSASQGEIFFQEIEFGDGPPPAINFDPGDFNQDGLVDAEDFLRWQAGYGMQTGATALNGDSDGDFDVDGSDFLAWQTSFGSGGSRILNSGTGIPEPSSFGILAILIATLFTFGLKRIHWKNS